MMMAMDKRRAKEKVNDTRSVQVCRDGPYRVAGSIPLCELNVANDADDCPYEYRISTRYPLQEAYSLCRCGQSQDKPFCDESHKEMRFSGTETATREPYVSRAEEVDGPELMLQDVRDLCSHVGMCNRAGGIRELVLHSNDPKARHIAIEEVANCDSGRLTTFDKQTGEVIEPEFEPSIAAIEEPLRGYSGPLWVRGEIPIKASDGTTYEIRNRVTLCRCGLSSHKPFCDGSHRGFKG